MVEHIIYHCGDDGLHCVNERLDLGHGERMGNLKRCKVGVGDRH